MSAPCRLRLRPCRIKAALQDRCRRLVSDVVGVSASTMVIELPSASKQVSGGTAMAKKRRRSVLCPADQESRRARMGPKRISPWMISGVLFPPGAADRKRMGLVGSGRAIRGQVLSQQAAWPRPAPVPQESAPLPAWSSTSSRGLAGQFCKLLRFPPTSLTFYYLCVTCFYSRRAAGRVGRGFQLLDGGLILLDGRWTVAGRACGCR